MMNTLDEMFSEKMRAECSGGDAEDNHIRADDILMELLGLLSMTKTKTVFGNTPHDIVCSNAGAGT